MTEPVVRLALDAMATRFELVLHGDDPVRLRAAGEEALREIERLEDILSFYRPAGALGRLNRSVPGVAHGLPAPLYDAVESARDCWARTGGAFDPTVGPLMRAWGMAGGTMRRPEADVLAEARSRCGFGYVRLDAASRAVAFERAGMAIDLGGIGKGFAIDEAVTVLREVGVPHALMHGGTSTVAAFGRAPDGTPWRVGVPDPRTPGTLLCTVDLDGAALSVSEPRSKGFEDDTGFHGHVIDPRSGMPTRAARLAAVRCASAAGSDAFATALLVDPSALDHPDPRNPGVDFVVVRAHPADILGRGLLPDPGKP